MIAQVLTALHKAWPTGHGYKRHHLTLNVEAQQLELGLWVDEQLQTFVLDEAELHYPDKLIADIRKLL